jgi:putative Holliday junction resolvase
MKILALDIGDVHTGTALSDELYITAQPYKTIPTQDLIKELETLFLVQPIKTVVVGHPKTMKGTDSAQTKTVVQTKEQLEKIFPKIKWVLWDERLTSKQATAVRIGNKQKASKESKAKEHSIAAAIILQTYLQFIAFCISEEPSLPHE